MISEHVKVMIVMGLSPRQRMFVAEYLVDFNGTQAAIRAGYSPNGANVAAFDNLTNPTISAAIEEKIEDRLEMAELSVEWVLKQWKKIAEADPSELCWTEVECCRHCYGVEHRYQWTDFEYREACERAAAHRCGKNCEQYCGKAVPPSPVGGFGFTCKKPPVADCPVCEGKGVTVSRVADIRHLKGSARRLYAGVKQTKDGIEIKMRDQDAALLNISKYFGMLIERKEITVPGAKPMKLANVDVRDLTDEQLVQVIQEQKALPATIEAVVE